MARDLLCANVWKMPILAFPQLAIRGHTPGRCLDVFCLPQTRQSRFLFPSQLDVRFRIWQDEPVFPGTPLKNLSETDFDIVVGSPGRGRRKWAEPAARAALQYQLTD
jgi:hypothetical protein